MNASLRKLTAVLLSISAIFAVNAEIPKNYYNSLNGKKDAELKTAAYNIIHNFTSVSSYSNLPDYFKRTDVRPDIYPTVWWDMYSDMEVPVTIRFGEYMNREHSFPKSWWGGDEHVKAYTDLNHLYPAEAVANQAKSNYPLGEVRTPSKLNNGVSKVGSPESGQGGGSAYVFEPADEYKGDFARTYFYMVTCYQDYRWATHNMYMLQQNTYPTLSGWAVDLLLKWSREDPVSDKETVRNENVYLIQNNRNPFIDFPELAEYIWGNKKGEVFKLSSSSGTTGQPALLAPVRDTALDFGQVAVGNTVKASLLVRGTDLSHNLSMFLFSGDKAMFSLSSSTIAASLVNREDGYWLDITYRPDALGLHETKLQIVCDDLDAAPPVVTLRGECLAKPVLNACTALDPSDITSDSYSANWSTPENDVVDYWVITRTRYSGGSQTTEEVMAESSPWTITGFNDCDYESYSVRSVRLSEYSPMSNTVFVRHSGISGVENEIPLNISTYPGLIRFECVGSQTNCRIFDISGRQIRLIETVTGDMEIEMPLGVYLITTDQHATPVKVLVR